MSSTESELSVAEVHSAYGLVTTSLIAVTC
jgi:hypothetical protein